MYEPELYEKSKFWQVNLANYFLEKYFHLVKLRSEGDDKILDIGSGDGEITVNNLFKRFTGKRKTIVGCDKSMEMLNFSREKYKYRENVTFKMLDIETKTLPVDMIEGFDHIFTFCCLIWVMDSQQAIKNVYKLLKPNGDLFVVTPSENIFFQSYYDISLGDSKWAKYLKEAHRFLPKYHYYKHPEEDFSNLLVKSSFKVVTCKSVCREQIFDNISDLKRTIQAISPFNNNIPPSELADFYEYVVSFLMEKKNCLEMQGDGRVIFKIYMLFAYATK